MLSPLTYLVIMIVLAAAGYFWLVHWSKLSLKKRGMDDRQANEAVHLAGKYSPLLTWARSVLVPDLATAGQHIKTWAARRICLRRQAADEGAEPSQSIADAEAQVIRRDELQIVHEEVTTDHAPSEIQQPAPVEKRKAEVRFQADLLAGQRFQVVVEGIRESAAAVGQGAAASGITNTGITQETVSFGVTSRQVEGMAVSPAASYAVTSPMPEPAEVLPAVSLSDFASPKAVNQVATVLLVGGIGLLAASLMVRQDIPVGKREALLLPGLSGLVMVMLAIYAQGRKSSSDWFQRVAFVLCNWLRISALQGICLITGLMAVVLGCIAAGDSAFLYNPILAVTGWLGGTGLVLVGAWRRTGGRPAISWRMWAWIGVIGLAALLMRVVDTAHIPVVLLGDEGSAGLSAINFINGQTNNIFGMGWRSFPALSFFIQSIFIKAFGNTIEALRVPAGVVGALTVIAAMLMARAMFSERVAILTGVFLAAFHYHIHFSRIGLNNVYDPLFYVITLGALWYGWHKERREYFLIAGLALGLAQYFYTSSRMLFAIIAVWLLMVGWLDRPRLKRILPNLFLMGLVMLASFLPYVAYYSRHFNDYIGIVRGVSIFDKWLPNEVAIRGQPALIIILKQLFLGLSAYIYTPLQWFYKPGVPMLRVIPAAFFLVGLLALKLRDSRTILLLLWLAGVAVIGGLSDTTPAAQRYVAAAPACVVLVALGVDQVASRLSNLWPRYGKWVSISAIFLVVCMAMDDARFYFYQYTPNSYFGEASDIVGYGGAVAQSLTEYLQDKPDNWKVYFFGAPAIGYYSIPSLPYLVPHIEGISVLYAWGSELNPPITGDRLIFVFLLDHETDLAGAQAEYPGGKLIEQHYRDGKLLYYLYEYTTMPADT